MLQTNQWSKLGLRYNSHCIWLHCAGGVHFKGRQMHSRLHKLVEKLWPSLGTNEQSSQTSDTTCHLYMYIYTNISRKCMFTFIYQHKDNPHLSKPCLSLLLTCTTCLPHAPGISFHVRWSRMPATGWVYTVMGTFSLVDGRGGPINVW